MKLISKNRPSHSLADIWRVAGEDLDAVRIFEQEFAHFVGASHAIVFPYCRVAMQMILELFATEGEEVLMPAYTCSVVAHAAARAKKVPRFLDIDPVTLNSPAEKFLARLNENVSAIIPTHMYGTPVDLSPLEAVDQPLLVIEDGSLGLQKAWKPQNPKLTTVTVYSFGSNKILSTVRGGIVVTHNAEIADRLQAYRDQRLSRATLSLHVRLLVEQVALEILFREAPYAVLDRLRGFGPLKKHLDTRSLEAYEFPEDAKYQFSGGQARIGTSQLRQARTFIARRQKLARRYTEALKDISGVEPMSLIPGSHYSHYALRVPRRDEKQFPQKMREAGIEVGKTFDYLVADLPLYKTYIDQDLPESRRAVSEVVNLPNYPALSDSQFERAVEAVKRTAK